MTDSRKPYKREQRLKKFRDEIHSILNDAERKTNRAIERVLRSYEKLEKRMNENANNLRSLKMKNYHRAKSIKSGKGISKSV
jgi:hypothetical protein